ncbi:baculoviral IAP repeat-containing protein 6 isoform X4 [Neoarius graeffei]|uniref:baculoviral IAP repeat-containing protein 6 isoform X4 n=1 Tax=Neoarius graeffei TaxID=443677 RepID=UPI00298C9286|nr:baculoviral IAP repeat-containing protein 6 isoform X4 [Neoarius graeffei]
MAAAGAAACGSAESSDWILVTDGRLRCDEEGLRSLSYHPALNAILAVTSRGSIKVIDGTSGAILQASVLHGACVCLRSTAKPGGRVRCQYFPAVDKVLFVDDYAVGCRKDLNGILLLDTALQAPVSKPEDMVQLELPVTEAQQMLYACLEKVDISSTEGYDLFLTQLKEGLKNTSHETAANHKVAKWATVTFHLPHHVLKLVASAIVNELKKLNQNIAALSVASSVMDRLSYLLPSARPELGVGPGRSVDRSLMYSEANRRETFTSWPHAGYRWAQPDPMAQAGFYHQPASTGDDRAMCFTCSVCLVCWEPTDEPWSEHERHSPNCPFVKGEHTQNVPLSVTLATSPAQFPSSDCSDKISCYGFGSCPHFLATATKRGKICVWDVSKLMKVHLKFEVNPYDPAILRQLILSGSEQQSVSGSDSRRPTLTWLEDTSSCSDIPKLEGDSDDQLEDSDSEEQSRSESVTGPLGPKESMEVSVGVTALSVLQQPEKLQWEVVASVLEDTVKDLEELGANPPHALGPSKVDKPIKDKPVEQHNIPFPCLLAGGLLSYRSAASSPILAPSQSHRPLENPLRTPTPAPEGLSPDQGPMEIETCTFPSELGSPGTLVRRTLPVLLLYSIKEADEKSPGKVFSQMNNLMGKGLHDEGFTVPQIIEMEFDTHEQLLLQDPPVTYIQQFADAAVTLDGDKWNSPRPGTLVQCLRLPKSLEDENLYVDSITPCSDGAHLLVVLQPFSVESLNAINQVEALNTLNRLHSALCRSRKGQTMANGHQGHASTSQSQTPLILPPLEQLDQPHSSRPLGGSGGGGYLALYKLNYSTRIVTLEEEPVKVQQIRDPRDAITSLLLLPPDVLDAREDDAEETSEESTPLGVKNGAGTGIPAPAGSGKEKRSDVVGLGHLVVTTQAGYVMILDLSTLEVLAKVEPSKKDGMEEVDPFVSVTYCSGTDRLCACTRGGELHFLQIGGVCDDIDDADIFVDGPVSKGVEQLLEGAKPSSNPSSPGITGVDLLVEQPLSVETLSSLVELTRFETLTPRFSATVPPCWVEVQQEQQQRRHPQHLHQQHHGDAAQHTRTWKLQSDSTSWDEHVFELVLPKACMVGHVDFKFVLNASITNIPQIQVTLLKNKAPGLGKGSESAVDRQIVFPLSHSLQTNGERNGQPLLHDFTDDIQFMDIEETGGSRLCPFLEDHKEDILCGPVWLASGLDLSGHAGMLSLTSPKLVKGMAGGKYRSFLVHIKAVCEKGPEESPRRIVRMTPTKPQCSNKTHSLSSLLQKAQASKEKASTSKSDPQVASKKPDNLRGCDLLLEVSITIRRFKKTSVPKERVQRCAMLQFPELQERLLSALCERSEENSPSEHAQSLILDVLCWLAGVYTNGPCSLKEGKEGLQAKTRKRLGDIVRVCFFQAGRSIAHKCARFLALCISNGKGEVNQQGFGQALLKALLDNMPYLPAAATGGSVYWYFVLLNYVKDEDLASCSTACASLLTAASRQLQERLTPLEALLQTRYGLYGSPFDPVLFDLEVSGASCKNSYSSIGVQSDEIDLSDILSGNGKVSGCGAAEGSFTSLTGLLEVEPLHFTCVSTSDGTRVERDDASMFTVSTFGVTPSVAGLSGNTVGEASTALSSAAQVALQSLSHAMVSAEQQLQVLQEKQQQLLKLQQQKAKLEAKLHQTSTVVVQPHGSVVSNSSGAPGFFIHPSDVIPPTPKTTPLFMTPPLTPPNEAVSAAIGAELVQLFPNNIIDPTPPTTHTHSKNTHKTKPNPMGSGLALAISQASHFLQPPPHQSIIIERMHSGARRFVTLDFGRPVLLTDALIPTCADLASLSIDIWTLGEEVDGRRLVVATDISTHSLILHDLLPPPVCRFMKITVIGRYGSTNARAKIPLGFYYGHTYILPWESELKLMNDPLRAESDMFSQPELEQHLAMMVALQEDIQCRYNLACHRLETLLQNVDVPPLNSANNAQYFLRKPDKALEEDSRVFSAYHDCAQLQLQLNLAAQAVQRLRVSLGSPRLPRPFRSPAANQPLAQLVQHASTEQLRTTIRYLLDTLLSLLHASNGQCVPAVLRTVFQAQVCEELFKQLCISGTPQIRLHAGLLLVQLCGAESWWGQFISNVLQELYNSEQLLIFPQDRVFMLLSCIGQRSLSNSGVLEGLLNLLDSLLSPLQQPSASHHRRTEGVLDIPMVSWVVMLVSRLLDYVASVEDEASSAKKPLGAKDRERTFTGNQWSFINNSLQSHTPSRSTKGNSSLDRLYSRKIRKQLVHHKQQLNLLKAKQKALVEQIEKEKIQSNKGSSYKLLVEQAKLKQATSKHFKDLIRLRRTAEWPRSSLDSDASSSTVKETPEVELLPFTLSHERCICVVQKLALFLLSMDFTCHADLLLFVCKVLARIANATRPTIHLCEVVSEQQLERLLLLLVGTDFNRGDISWGGAWAQYSLTCMLQDILAGELMSPVCVDVMEEGAVGDEGAVSSSSSSSSAVVVLDSEDSLAPPTPLTLVETIDEPLGPDLIAGTPGSSSAFQSAPPLSSLEKDKDIDFDLLQDLMDVDIDPLDIDLEKDPLAAKVFKPISSTWYDYWGADYGTYSYNPYIGGAGIPVSKPPAAVEKPGSQNLSVSVSQALDARLEVGLEQQAELMLKMMATLEADAILQALTSNLPAGSQATNGTDDSLLRGMHGSPPGGSVMVQPSSIPMLSACFNKLFSMLQVHHVQLESLLQLWLTLSLNSSSGSEESGSDIFLFNSSRVPTIPLNQASISSFLSVLAWYPNTSLRTWCLVLHSLTLMTNMPASASNSGIVVHESTAQQMVSDPTLVHVMVRFLSGSNPHGTSQHSSQVGPTATQAMHEFLTRLQVHLSSTCPQMFSEFLLKLVHILSTERGPFHSGQGPLDAQVKLLEFTLEQNFEVVSVTTITAVIESITFLVHHYITCSEKVVSRSGSDGSVCARACFGGLFANIIRPGDAKAACGETTRDQLMFDLLKLVNALVTLPLSGDREYSGRMPSNSVSDEEKVCSGGKEGGASGHIPNQGLAMGVADLVLANQQIMSQILSALGQCNSSAMAMIIGASGLHLTKHENFHGGLDAISVGDGLFTILTTLSKRATSVQVMLQPILTYMACGYMGRQGSLSTCQLSEPLLWFILRVLDTSEALKVFHDMGGVQLICNNMVTSTRAIVNTARSMVSTIMKFLDSGPGKAADGSLKARVLASEPENAEGLHNFAPLGTITSSSPTAQPAEVLLQATPPHRRARSAAWSYIFLPEEAWCDLTIHLPAAVLLKELHIQPHLASLATCPSSVSVEISADGVNMLPLSTPLVTSGLTYIKIQLVRAEVASAVCVRLHRPRDASTLGLSQIKLLGLTAFGSTSSATVNNPFLPSEDQVSKTSIGWLRLLHHCVTHVSDLEAMMASAAAQTANLLQTCAALLMSPYCGMHSPNIEAVLVKIGLQSTRIGLKLIHILLRNCAASGTDLANLNSPLLFGRLNGLSSDSTIDILYQLGTTQDPGTKDRIQALLQWVYDSSRVAALKQNCPSGIMGPAASQSREYGLLMPSPSHLHCVAAILWHSYELPVDYDLPTLLSRELFELLYNWSMALPCNMVLKKAVDSLLCSMCHIHPSYFSMLMSWMGLSAPAMTDDGKKQHELNSATSLTDDSKLLPPVPISLTECQLATLASASQSPGAIQQLLDSGLPALLVRSLANFCCQLLAHADLPMPAWHSDRRHHNHTSSAPSLSPDLAAPVLRFLTEVGNSHAMKDWLGGPDVNPLWTSLLFLLCHSSASGTANGANAHHAMGTRSYSLASHGGRGNSLSTQQRTAIENATVAFFLQCISCHPSNQRLMAQVLCELFQSAPQRGNVPVSGNISGFIRRLFLQLMLEDEKVTVFLQSPCPLYKGRINATSHVIQHPMYGAGHKFRKLHLPISTTLAEVLDRVSDTPSITAKLLNEQKEDKEKKNHEEKEKMKADNGFQDNYSVVVASGLKSQSKRALSTPPRPPSRRGRVLSDKLASSSGVESSSKTISVPVFHLYHKLLPGQPLPGEMTLAQLLTLLYERKLPQGYRSIDLSVKLGSKVISDSGLSKTDSFKRLRTEKEHCDVLSSCVEDEMMTPVDECLDAAIDESLLETSPIQSPLQVFAGMGGLALIAERLPMLYPDVIQQVSTPVVASSSQEKPKDSEQFEWVTIEQSGELVYEAPESVATEPQPIKSSVQTTSPIPAHSLAAFGLFLRLPGYAEVLLKERKHAQCLLRLVLGVTDDGEGSHILQSPSANVLPTLPFLVLRSLFSSTPLTTDDGVLLRRMALEIGAVHLILACLSALSHHAPRVPSSNSNHSEPQVSSGQGVVSADDQQLYWAKGTGFGTGSTASGWDVEQALNKQRLEEEHVTCLLQVLASYINPAGCVCSGDLGLVDGGSHSSAALPSVLQELLSQSCLIPAMSSYLRNDSVLDMARHVPLYRALLELLRALSSCSSLVPLLLPLSTSTTEEEEEEEPNAQSHTSVSTLLAKMKTCVDTYTNRLRSKKDKSKGVMKAEPSDPEPEGLTLLVPDIQKTAEIVYAATTSLRQANHERKLAECSRKTAVRPKPLSNLRSLEEKYVAAMKKLQFDTFEMVCEDEDGKLVFKVNYHYLSQVKNASDANSAARARRLAQEAVTLSTSLPLSSSSSVFVRCDEERLDIMKVLITGPADTPYANGCFEFDVYFPQDYPNSPPLVNLETTGGHSVRFNPNLYNDGKVCLSILNTWHGRPEEKWNPQTSSFLQVLVSVQSLILVCEPYFNEPGYERSRGTPSGTQSSREYDGNIRQATVKWAMLEQIRNPSPCFKEVIHKHFYLKRAEIMAQCEEWISDIQQYSSDKRVGRTMSHHAAALKRHTAQLREELLKLPCPEGLEPDGEEFSEKSSALSKDLPSQEAEKQSDAQCQDAQCSDGQI